jgi:hypothetical protein
MMATFSTASAKTYRQSHLRSTSGMAPTPDLLSAMSGFQLISSGVPSGPDMGSIPKAAGIATAVLGVATFFLVGALEMLSGWADRLAPDLRPKE